MHWTLEQKNWKQGESAMASSFFFFYMLILLDEL